MGYQFASGAQVMAIICQADMMWSGPLPECQRTNHNLYIQVIK